MAKLPSLVSAITQVDGREHKSIDHVARVIREAGHMPTAGRGGAAADMDVRAAVNLLLGLNCADTPKDAPLAIDLMRGLKPMTYVTRDNLPAVLKSAAAASNFGEALEALIEGLPELLVSLWEYHLGAFDTEERPGAAGQLFKMTLKGWGPVNLRIQLSRGFAETVLERPGERGEPVIEWHVKFRARVDPPDALTLHHWAVEDLGAGRDRKVTTTVGLPTLLAIWQCVFDSDDEAVLVTAGADGRALESVTGEGQE